MMKMWNMWLIFATFLLAIFGTFLTRSGVVSSVHAFAQSSIGPWFSTFLAISFAACMVAFVANRKHQKSENKLESLVSRESSFLFNNLVLLAACFAVLWGTLFPVLSEWVQGTKITVGPPFFNRVMTPITLFLLLLTAVGPLLAWRSTSWESLKRNFTIPAALAVVAAIVLVALGWRPWQELSQFYSLMAIALSVLVMATVGSEFFRGARVIAEKTGSNLLAAMVQLTRRNTRRYGGYIVHVGIVLAIIGFAGQAFNTDTEKELGPGDSMKIGNYTLTLDSSTQDDNPNFSSESAIVNVFQDGRKIDTLYPERRFFKASQQTATIVADRSTLKEDLYLVYTGDSDSGRPILKAHINPLVIWFWIGIWVLIAGTGIALVPNVTAAALRHPARAQAATVEAGD